VGDDRGTVVSQRAFELDVKSQPDRAVARACDQLDELRDEQQIDLLAGIVAGLCAPTVHPPNGAEHGLRLWGIAAEEQIAARFTGTPVRLETSAALGAYGELHAGAGRDHPHFIYVCAGRSAGIGLVLNGAVHTGAAGLAGRLGRHWLAGGGDVDRGDEDAAGSALAWACDLLNPTAVIVNASDWTNTRTVVAGLRASIDRLCQPATAATVVVIPGLLCARAATVGALLQASSLVA
jgi:hypothetical protein